MLVLFQEKLKNKNKKSTTLKFESESQRLGGERKFPDRILFVKNDYARLGEYVKLQNISYLKIVHT